MEQGVLSAGKEDRTLAGEHAPASVSRFLSPRQAWAVGLLSLLYIFSIVDRTIPSIIIGPLKERFALTDVHIGLLLGTAFGVVYSLLGLPAARLVDRGVRTTLIFLGVTIWCLATIGSAFATSFGILMLMRLGLAAGESILAPAAHSMIGDLVHPDSRSLAASIFQAIGALGPPIAFFGGGILLEIVDASDNAFAEFGLDGWQIVLIMVGAPGLALGLLFYLTVQEPPRAHSRGQHVHAPLTLVVRQFKANARLYVGLLLAASFPAAAGYAFIYWSVELLSRNLGWTTKEAGMAFGTLYLVGGVGGTLLAPWLSRKLKAAGRPDYGIVACFACAVLGLIGFGLAPLQSGAAATVALLCLGIFGFNGTTQNIVVAMQEVAPSNMRGTFVATLFLVIGLFGLGVGPAAAPAIAAMLSTGGERLGAGLAISGVFWMVGSIIALFYVRADFISEAERGFPAVSA